MSKSLLVNLKLVIFPVTDTSVFRDTHKKTHCNVLNIMLKFHFSYINLKTNKLYCASSKCIIKTFDGERG